MNYDSCATEENSKHSSGVKLGSVPKQQLATDEVLNRLDNLSRELLSIDNRLDNKVNSIMGYDNEVSPKCMTESDEEVIDGFLSKIHDIISDCDRIAHKASTHLDRLDKII